MRIKFYKRLGPGAEEQKEIVLRTLYGKDTKIPYLGPRQLRRLMAYNSTSKEHSRIFLEHYNKFVEDAQNNVIIDSQYEDVPLVVTEEVVSKGKRGESISTETFLTPEGLLLFLKKYNRLFQYSLTDLKNFNQSYGERINAEPNSSWPTQRLYDALVNKELLSADEIRPDELELERLLQTRNIFYVMRNGLDFRVGKTTNILDMRLRNHNLFNTRLDFNFCDILIFEKDDNVDCVTFENNFFKAAEKLLNVTKQSVEVCRNRNNKQKGIKSSAVEYAFTVEHEDQVNQIIEMCYLNPRTQYQGLIKRFTDINVLDRLNSRA